MDTPDQSLPRLQADRNPLLDALGRSELRLERLRRQVEVLTAALAFLYYMGLISFISLARQGTLSPEAAVWLPNLLFAIGGIVMLARLERPGDLDLIGMLGARIGAFRQPVRGPLSLNPQLRLGRFSLLPRVTDTYVLSGFLFYFVLLLASFVLMFQIFTFFELLSDIIRNRIPMNRVLTYHLFLTPRLIYELAPFGVLTAVLVAFGVLVPLLHGFAGAYLGHLAGLNLGGCTIFAAIVSSASYIAAPPAVRLTLPEANPTLSITAALAITFPFNIALGIPIYFQMSHWVGAVP